MTIDDEKGGVHAHDDVIKPVYLPLANGLRSVVKQNGWTNFSLRRAIPIIVIRWPILIMRVGLLVVQCLRASRSLFIAYTERHANVVSQ